MTTFERVEQIAMEKMSVISYLQLLENVFDRMNKTTGVNEMEFVQENKIRVTVRQETYGKNSVRYGLKSKEIFRISIELHMEDGVHTCTKTFFYPGEKIIDVKCSIK